MLAGALCFAVALFAACAGGWGGRVDDSANGAGDGRVERLVVAMGTALHVDIAAADRATALRASEAVVRAVQDADGRLSTWRDDSELARFHAAPVGAAFAASPRLLAELRRVWHWARATDGAFDPCVGALVRAYDLRGSGRWPGDAEIEQIRARGGFRKISIGATLVRRSAVEIEEGAFGKGAALDAAVQAARAAGARSGRLDFGGQVVWFGGRGGHIDLADPRARDRAVLRLIPTGRSAATTGNGERRRTVAGRHLGHVLDPRSGRPARDFGSVTVICDAALDADCLSTACFVLGPDEALAFAERTAGVEVVLLEAADEQATLSARVSSGLRGRCTALVPELQLR